jgi:transcriptional regulator
MARQERCQNSLELLQGTLDMRTLQFGTQHGHGIDQVIRATSNEALQIEQASLYPALHRLARQGWFAPEWKQSEANRRSKYYRLTAAGKRQLALESPNGTRWSTRSRA